MILQPVNLEDINESDRVGNWIMFDTANITQYTWGKEFFSLLPLSEDLTADVLAGSKILIIRSRDLIVR